MQNYIIKKYQVGFEHEQARIGLEVARNWIWPYAYDLADLVKAHSQTDFDPDCLHFCFLNDEMVGYLSTIITRREEDGNFAAQIDFPRMLPGHEAAAELLMESGLKTLQIKGVSQVNGRVSTMCPGDIQLAEKMGFNIHDWGYKVYYTYKMEWGNLNLPEPEAEDIKPKKGLNESARIATHWYKQSQDLCLSLLEEWHKAGVIADLGVIESGKMVAGCMVAPNPIRHSTAAIYYIYTPNERCLRSLLPKVISKCIDFGSHNVIADLINEHRQYEPLYQELGYKKSTEWARCEKELM